jgi:hypothetical protein
MAQKIAPVHQQEPAMSYICKGGFMKQCHSIHGNAIENAKTDAIFLIRKFLQIQGFRCECIQRLLN